MSREADDFELKLTGDMSEESSKSNWFKRITKGILTSTDEKKKDGPEGLWEKCPECKYTCTKTELEENKFTCPECNYHHRIGSAEYFDILFDNKEYEELFANVRSVDKLNFVDLKPYSKRLEETYAKTDIHDSITVAHGLSLIHI